MRSLFIEASLSLKYPPPPSSTPGTVHIRKFLYPVTPGPLLPAALHHETICSCLHYWLQMDITVKISPSESLNGNAVSLTKRGEAGIRRVKELGRGRTQVPQRHFWAPTHLTTLKCDPFNTLGQASEKKTGTLRKVPFRLPFRDSSNK